MGRSTSMNWTRCPKRNAGGFGGPLGWGPAISISSVHRHHGDLISRRLRLSRPFPLRIGGEITSGGHEMMHTVCKSRQWSLPKSGDDSRVAPHTPSGIETPCVGRPRCRCNRFASRPRCGWYSPPVQPSPQARSATPPRAWAVPLTCSPPWCHPAEVASDTAETASRTAAAASPPKCGTPPAARRHAATP